MLENRYQEISQPIFRRRTWQNQTFCFWLCRNWVRSELGQVSHATQKVSGQCWEVCYYAQLIKHWMLYFKAVRTKPEPRIRATSLWPSSHVDTSYLHGSLQPPTSETLTHNLHNNPMRCGRGNLLLYHLWKDWCRSCDCPSQRETQEETWKYNPTQGLPWWSTG